MKKIFLCATIAVSMCFASCEGFDASDILDRLDNLENQLENLKNNEENNQEGENSDNEDSTDNNKIYYTTSDNTRLFPKTDASLYGAILISNTYKDGQGILVFDDVVTLIGSNAFVGCSTLKSITIPNTVEIIGGAAFYGCSSLNSVILPDNVVKINSKAFFNCTSLKEVYCKPKTPPTGGQEMFYYAKSTTSVPYPINCKIYVPRASLEEYKSAVWWSGYASDIVGCDF